MKNQIVSNDYFDLQIDVSKNRIYATFYGYWPKMQIMDDYRSHMKKVLSMVKPNFTLVANLTQFKTLPPELVPKQQDAMVDLAKAGMFKVAEILPASAIAGMQLKQSAVSTKMPNRQFSSVQQGESWLDSEVAKL